ncbi:MAG: alpha/beta fold hydrolase [Anaerolineae bacterium]
MSLYVHKSGDPAAPAIVWLHGAGLSGRMWLPQFERLPDHYCLAPDLPEHGKSAAVGPLTMEDTVRRVADLIAECAAGGRAHLVGLSFGGVVAQALLCAAPERIDHVVLSGTAMRLSPILLKMQALNEPVLRLLSPDTLARLLAIQFGIPPAYREMLHADMAAFTPAAFGRVNATYGQIEAPRAAQNPTLVLVGQKETLPARRMARSLMRAIPGAVGAVAPGVGHVWNLQAPGLFADTVRAWVNDAPLPPDLLPVR